MRIGLLSAGMVMLTACAGAVLPLPNESTLIGDALILRGVSIINTDSATVSEPQDILMSGGLIVSVAPAGVISVTNGARTIDGSGLFAMPGLIDVHAHLGEGGLGPQDEVARARALGQFLRYGVTTILVPGAAGAGDADFPKLRAACTDGSLTCPGLYGTGSLITARGGHPVTTIFGLSAETPAEVVEARCVTVLAEDATIPALIAAKAEAGFSAVKIIIEDGPPPWYPRPRLSNMQIGQITASAHSHGLNVYAHVSTAAQVDVALEMGVDGIMHAPTDLLANSTVAQMAESGMWYVATLSLYDGLFTWARGEGESDPYAIKGVPPAVIESLANEAFLAAANESEERALAYLEAAKANLLSVAAAGVPIALGSDVSNPFVFPGFSAHEELAAMVAAGLTPGEALRAATRGSAGFLSEERRLGLIRPGFEADLVLLTRNPLENILNSRSLVAVVSDGALIEDVVSAN